MPRRLISQVIAGKGQVAIGLDWPALHDALAAIDDQVRISLSLDESIEIKASALALRCGKQVRLVL